MPYIPKSQRKSIDEMIDNVVMENPGELNYAITRLLLGYLLDKKNERGHTSYQDINDVLGALEGAKLEFYRRGAATYETKKIKENGDVY